MDLTRRNVVPSSVVNEGDQGALLTITVALGISYMLLFLGTRVLIRWPWSILWGMDDTCVAVATLFGVIHACLTIEAVAAGLGEQGDHLGANDAMGVQKWVYTTDLLFILATYTDKCSVALFSLRLSSARSAQRYCLAIMIACGVCFATSMFALALQAPISSPWKSAMSHNRLSRWIAVEVMSMCLEIGIAAFPIYLVRGLQMGNAAKLRVIVGYWVRLVLVPLAIIRLLSFAHATKSNAVSRIYHFVFPAMFLQIEMCYGIIAATLSCLRVFFRSASLQFLGGQNYVQPTGTQLPTADGGSYKMSNIRRSRRDGNDGLKLTSNPHETLTQATRGGENDGLSFASDSSQMGIVVRHTVDLAYD